MKNWNCALECPWKVLEFLVPKRVRTLNRERKISLFETSKIKDSLWKKKWARRQWKRKVRVKSISYYWTLPPFSLIRDFRKQNTHGNVSEISVNHTCYRQIGLKSTNHSPLAWRKEGLKFTLVFGYCLPTSLLISHVKTVWSGEVHVVLRNVQNTSENGMQSWSTSACMYFARSMIGNSFNMRDKLPEMSANNIQTRGKFSLHYCCPTVVYMYA